MENKHIILGTGAVGTWITKLLIAEGKKVQAVNSSGRRPILMPTEVEIIKADLLDRSEAIRACEGATVIFQALNPPYHLMEKLFPILQKNAIEAAIANKSKYISIDNLYMYEATKPISEKSLIKPISNKGRTRARASEELLDLLKSGQLKGAILRASDFYGPGVRNSQMGERVFQNIVIGKKAQLVGSISKLHSFAFIEDIAKAAIILANEERALGKVWIGPHAKARTQKDYIDEMAMVLNKPIRYSVLSKFMMSLAGLFIPPAKASVEMMYQFTEDFVVDSQLFTNEFKLEATELSEGIKRTINWYKDSTKI